MTRWCDRCGREIENPDRRQIEARDLAESTGAIYSGSLCVSCWKDFAAFMTMKLRQSEPGSSHVRAV